MAPEAGPSSYSAQSRLFSGAVDGDNNDQPRGSVSSSVQSSTNRRPVSTLQQTDPREYEIRQVIRRFSSNREETAQGTLLAFKLIPSDPDFPFELQSLSCLMTIPQKYPRTGVPTIRIRNAEMDRGYQINVEKGFDALFTNSSNNKTLLALLNDLDRNLETFLSSQKAQTFTFIRHADQRRNPIKVIPGVASVEETGTSKQSSKNESPEVIPKPVIHYTSQQKVEASTKRQADVRQLEARMGRIPMFSKTSTDAEGLTTYNIPLQISKPGRLPSNLQSMKEVSLQVPHLYNLEPCTIKIRGIQGEDVQTVELAFKKYARDHPSSTLMAHINYLSQNIHSMVSGPAPKMEEVIPPSISLPLHNVAEAEVDEPDLRPPSLQKDQDRPHIRFIPRPPEWDLPQEDSSDDSTESYDSDEMDSEDDEDEEDGGAPIPTNNATTVVEKGLLISFPDLELSGIELLQLSSLSITVKCDRCKEISDIKHIKPNNIITAKSSQFLRTETCSKCSQSLSATYHSELMHANSYKAGHLELQGCSILDMLPSTFIPTCSSCSTSYPQPTSGPDLNAVRGDRLFTTCRHCYQHLNFSIPQLKFLLVTSTLLQSTTQLQPSRQSQLAAQGIHPGHPLPETGTCTHYRKSHRWFRFSCCNRLYPCDLCHNTAPSNPDKHPNDHAERMLCGYCSREQSFRPKDCVFCGSLLIGGRSATAIGSSGFWEGGKGTRDKSRMRRKDTRKFKRVGTSATTVATGGTGKGKEKA